MRQTIRCAADALAAAALLCAAAAAAGENAAFGPAVELDPAPTGEQMALDLVIVRPLSLAGTVLGIGVFVVALPFNALALNFSEPARALILEPAKYTFTRKLGDLE